MTYVWVVDALLLAAFIPAVVWDLRYREIPPTITFPAIGAGLLAALAFHGLGADWLSPGLRSSVLGGLLAFLIFGLFYLLNFMGRGDLRLMIGVGTLVGFPQINGAMLFVVLVGGVQGVLAALGRTRPGRALLRRLGWDTSAPDFGETVPYGVAIALGTVGFRIWMQLPVPAHSVG